MKIASTLLLVAVDTARGHAHRLHIQTATFCFRSEYSTVQPFLTVPSLHTSSLPLCPLY